jgi:sporulation protein YlmC with PRC-barrel domain
MKKLALTAILAGLASPIMAQTPANPPANQPVTAPRTDSAAAAINRFMNRQGQNQWLASNLIGKDVYNASGQSIGDLNDVLVGEDGRIIAIIVGVGGFLGLGEKDVAVDYNFLKSNGGITGDRVVLAMNEQDLRAAPDFEEMRPAAAENKNTGTATGTGTAAGGGTSTQPRAQ